MPRVTGWDEIESKIGEIERFVRRPQIEYSLLDQAPRFDGHLFMHRFFINYGGKVLPCVDYYVVREAVVYHIHLDTMKETPSGDSFTAFLLNTEHLGPYDPAKVIRRNFDWIKKDDLFAMLEKPSAP